MATSSSRSVAGYSSSQHLKERATGARSPREYRDEEDDEREHGHEAHSPTGGSFDEGMFRQAGSPRGFGSAFHAGSQYHRLLNLTSGVGRTGMVTPEALARMSKTPAIMSCAGHVKVINGKVFFRYGGFFREYYRLNRFLQTVKMIHDAVVQYQLTDMRIELFVNTCDHPMAFYSSHIDDRPGIPMMSTGFTADTMDIPVPDPLDLTEDYTPDLATQIPWERKEARAVFRGKTTSYLLIDGNWGANPRIRLHRISDAHPSLMDAHINRWSHSREKAQNAMKADGVVTAPRMNFTQFNAFKYQVLVDGGGGSCRTCGVLRSNQLSIRQETPIFQFYEPLLQDRVHWLTTTRTFSDLTEKVRWAQENDEEVQRLVQAANQFATYACTWTGRTLYWGLILVKYYDTLHNPDAITEPPVKQICDKSPMLKAPPNTTADPASVKCADPDALKKNPECIFFCSSGTINHFIWHKAEALADLEKVGPP
ncbi:unnamed protein product [Closterium sp. Naga37s-1]|nr:unnamed protein product [Closterium sp. Naga37s-1]